MRTRFFANLPLIDLIGLAFEVGDLGPNHLAVIRVESPEVVKG